MNSTFFATAKSSAVDPIEAFAASEWPQLPERCSARPANEDWLFWTFFVCVATAALPLIGVRWTIPPGLTSMSAMVDTVLLSIPALAASVVFGGRCVIRLVNSAEAWTLSAGVACSLAVLVGAGGLHALLVTLT